MNKNSITLRPMKSFLWLIILALPIQFSAQEKNILWNQVPINEIDPLYLKSQASLRLLNGKITPMSEVSIDFDDEKIYYWLNTNEDVFALDIDDFDHISVSDYKDGNWVSSEDFFYDVADEIGAFLRQNIYETAVLNEVQIKSIIKEGFFDRKAPNFDIDSDGNLTVTNQTTIYSKLLGISPDRISYIDESGDVWRRKQNKLFAVTQTAGSKAEDFRKRRKARRQADILNLVYGDSIYAGIKPLYDYYFSEYKKKSVRAILEFKNDLIGTSLDAVLSDWGPFSEMHKIDDNRTVYNWIFPKTITETEGLIKSTTTSKSEMKSASLTSARADIYSSFGITGRTNINASGYGVVVNSYKRINQNTFLDFYSRNVSYAYVNRVSSTTSNKYETSVTNDHTRKLSIIVNNETNKIQEVISNNYFPYPKYGTEILFYTNEE